MSPAYVHLRALRLCCRWIAERATPHQIPVVVSRAEPADHGSIVMLERVTE